MLFIDDKKSPTVKRKGSLADSVKGKHDTKGNRGKQAAMEPEAIDVGPPPAMEVKLSVRLRHWECTADCTGDETDDEVCSNDEAV